MNMQTMKTFCELIKELRIEDSEQDQPILHINEVLYVYFYNINPSWRSGK